MSGVLYLVPVPIGDGAPVDELAPRVLRTVAGIRDFIVENERSARRFLARAMPQEALDASSFSVLDEHTKAADLPGLLAPLLAGRDAAIVSEAGSPCVADPGASLVAAASRAGIRSVPLPGPSAILMALMASGLGGQRFSFNGYLPPDAPGREAALKALESRSAGEGSTQLFIETPYRNDAMVASAAKALADDTLLCVAVGLSTPEERVIRKAASAWRSGAPAIGKTPAVFLLAAAEGAAGTGPLATRQDARPRRGPDDRKPPRGKDARPGRRRRA